MTSFFPRVAPSPKFLALALVAVAGLTQSAQTQCRTTQRLDVTLAGQPGAGVPGFPVISASGQFAFFVSQAEDLVPGDANGVADLFRVNLANGAIERLNLGPGGLEADLGHGQPWLSPNAFGHRVAFSSWASNLVSTDLNGVKDIFVRDTSTGATSRVSELSNGTGGDNHSSQSFMSADGKHVAFSTFASNFANGDANGLLDVYIRDVTTGVMSLVSANVTGEPGDDRSAHGVPSAEGRWVAFESEATDLVPGVTSGTPSVFIRQMSSGITTLVSVGLGGAAANGNSSEPRISGDGQKILFTSSASNLVAGDMNGLTDLFVHDRMTGETVRVNVNSLGREASAPVATGSYSISGDGRFVVFATDADDLVPGDQDGRLDIFRHDLWTRETLLVTRDDPSGGFWPHVSADGSRVVFYGSFNAAGNNGGIFVHTLWPTPQNFCTASTNSTGQPARMASSGAPDPLSAAGPAFTLVASPVPNSPGVFIYGLNQTQTPLGNGFRCVSGPGRVLGPVRRAQGRVMRHRVRFHSPAASLLLPGSTWNFQAWFRDRHAGGLGSNLSDGLRVEFCP